MSLSRSLCLAAVSAMMAISPNVRAASGDIETSFSNFPSFVYGTAIQPDGKIIVTGASAGLRRYSASGVLEASGPIMNANAGGVRVLPDGKMLVDGLFTTVGATARSYVVRLNADLTVDTSFNANLAGTSADPGVYATVVQPDGKTIVAGIFNSSNGVTRNNIARINADGTTLDTAFNPNVNGPIYTMARQPDGKILIGGNFTSVGSAARYNVARLNANGSVDTSFAKYFTGGYVNCVVLQPDGKILVGGNFTTVDLDERPYLARLSSSGTLDSGFNPAVDNGVYSISLQADGKMIVDGKRAQESGQSYDSAVRLNVNGTADASFKSVTDGFVLGIANQADGKVLLGGVFRSINGVTTESLARVENEHANQSLHTYSGNRIDWLRGGTAPEGEGVTFELSTNGGSTWAVLGNGSRITGGWRLSGLTLPASGLVRGRIVTSYGEFNSSASIVQEVAPIGLRPEIVVEQFPSAASIGNGWTYNFGPAGSFAESRQFTIRNTGTANLTGLNVTLDGANASDFLLSVPSGSVLAAQTSMTFTVNFMPKASGLRNAAVHITSNDYDEPTFDIPLKGTGVIPDIVVYQPAATAIAGGGSKAFGAVLVGQNTSLEFTVKNPGSADLTGVGAAIDGEHASEFSVTSNPAGTVSGPTGSTTFTVRYAPTTTGAKTARLRVSSNVASKNPYEITLTGTAITPEIMVMDSTSVDIPNGGARSFPMVVTGSSKRLDLVVLNAGDAMLESPVVSIIGPDASQFSAPTSPLASVNPGGTVNFSVDFAPTTAGTKNATLRIVSNDADENPFDVALTGQGLVASADEDGDGVPNGTEVALAQLGFDPLVDSSALRALVQANAAGLGITGGVNEEFLALGSPVLEKNPATGKFHLRISLERSTNLNTWSPLPGFTPTYDAVNGRIDLEITPGGANEYLRVFGAKP